MSTAVDLKPLKDLIAELERRIAAYTESATADARERLAWAIDGNPSDTRYYRERLIEAEEHAERATRLMRSQLGAAKVYLQRAEMFNLEMSTPTVFKMDDT